MTVCNLFATRAIVLAAGQGKRMKSTTAKVLHDVLGKPILGRILDQLDELCLEKIHIVVGHESEQLQAWLQDNPPKTPCTTHLQKQQLGTGHAVKQVVPELANFKGTLLVTVGDAPLQTAETLGCLIREHQQKDAVVSLLTTFVEDTKSYGHIVRDSAGNVARIVEDRDASPEEKLIKEINPAIYCFAWPAIAEGLNTLTTNNQQAEYYLGDLISWASTNNLPIASVVAPDWQEFAGINTRLELAEASKHLRDRVVAKLATECGVTVLDPASTWIAPEVSIGMDTTVLPGCYLIGDISIGSGCLVGPHTVMRGPMHIGDNTSVAQSTLNDSEVGSECSIGPFAHLRKQAFVAQSCRVGNFVEIKNSTIGIRSKVSHLSYVGDATLGADVNLGAGTITANYDAITRKKSHTTIGDNSSTGSNSVIVAPVVVGSGCSVAAGSVVTRDVPDGALAVARNRQQNIEGWVERKKSGKTESCKSSK